MQRLIHNTIPFKTIHYTVYNLQCTVYIVQCIMYNFEGVHGTFFTWSSLYHSARALKYNARSTGYISQSWLSMFIQISTIVNTCKGTNSPSTSLKYISLQFSSSFSLTLTLSIAPAIWPVTLIPLLNIFIEGSNNSFQLSLKEKHFRNETDS